MTHSFVVPVPVSSQSLIETAGTHDCQLPLLAKNRPVLSHFECESSAKDCRQEDDISSKDGASQTSVKALAGGEVRGLACKCCQRSISDDS